LYPAGIPALEATLYGGNEFLSLRPVSRKTLRGV